MTAHAQRGPLSGLRVLVPRATGDPDPVAIALAAAGAEPVTVELITTVPPEDPTELDDLLLALGAHYYTWLVVTSGATLPVLASRAEEVGSTLAELVAGTRVAAVGPATARALRQAGVQVDLVPRGTSSAAALLEQWPAASGEGRILAPHADLASRRLVDGLRARGWEVDDVVAYRTLRGAPPEPQVRAAWSAGEIDAALLTSGSTARHLIELLGPPPPGVLVCCIGPSTEAEARRLGIPVAGVAQSQTPAGLVEALVQAAATENRAPR
ncbi:uroporphyrinogen-III synthase [Cellulomonas chengniuliangii]|uniref:Uroporphyrinogen-III synthase n=1 Tax=Cellulomonas chengniuliangii TaxID=2968084 RepID=A0ABY5KZW5_9CELL|nr:uroporphyrinogen-III synthase [Cellulomonas chengniuliangii]MCC2309211.1 uroporphyrinogen-III synthase [Cellulomonas chengniuliangii]UUI75213.1 uroporphyrinogen-III synthase [Cellulomonas chengniuliangii]